MKFPSTYLDTQELLLISDQSKTFLVLLQKYSMFTYRHINIFGQMWDLIYTVSQRIFIT